MKTLTQSFQMALILSLLLICSTTSADEYVELRGWKSDASSIGLWTAVSERDGRVTLRSYLSVRGVGGQHGYLGGFDDLAPVLLDAAKLRDNGEHKEARNVPANGFRLLLLRDRIVLERDNWSNSIELSWIDAVDFGLSLKVAETLVIKGLSSPEAIKAEFGDALDQARLRFREAKPSNVAEQEKPNKAEMATPRKPSDHFGS